MEAIALILRVARLYMSAEMDKLQAEAEDGWNAALEEDDHETAEEKYKYYCGVIDAKETALWTIDEMIDIAQGRRRMDEK